MPANDTATFVQSLRQYELVSGAQADEIARTLQPRFADVREFAQELARRGYLTDFQAGLLLQDRGQGLLMGPYRLLDRLGEGGMGKVFKARHVHMDRIVSLKVIASECLGNPSAVSRFYREVRAVAQLSHPNIVSAYEVNQEGQTHYFAMEFIEGIDLARMVQQSGVLPIPQACDYVCQAALGLQHAHEKGLVHRDIKPGNLIVGRSSAGGNPVVKILDFGLARIETRDEKVTRLTKFGDVLGTVDYISPEQAGDARDVDIRSDIFSLGCSLFYLLTGKGPFAGADAAERMIARVLRDAPSVRIVRPDVPAGLEKLLAKMLARDPAERFQTPAELATALKPFSQERNAVADVLPTARGSSTKAKRKQKLPVRSWALVAGGAMVAVIVALIIYLMKPEPGPVPVGGPKTVGVKKSDVGPALPTYTLKFDKQPTNGTAGQLFEVTVRVVDKFGNAVPTCESTITLTTDPKGARFEGETTKSAKDGEAIFKDLVIKKAGEGYRLVAKGGAPLKDTMSESFNITPADPDRLEFKVQPTNGVAGPVNPVKVEVQDEFKNRVDTEVTLQLYDPREVAKLEGGTTGTKHGNGVTSFDKLVIKKAGQGYAFKATSGGRSSPFSDEFDMTAGIPDRYQFVQQPKQATAGKPVNPAVKVKVQDEFENPVDTEVTLQLDNPPEGAKLEGGTTRTKIGNGDTSFDELVIQKAGKGYRLTAKDLKGGPSASFDIKHGAVHSLKFKVEPTSAVAGKQMKRAVEVKVVDEYQNPVSGEKVTLEFYAKNEQKKREVVLGLGRDGWTASTNDDGVAIFDNLLIRWALEHYTLKATVDKQTTPPSKEFNITVGEAYQLEFDFDRPPNTIKAGKEYPVKVNVCDEHQNIVETDNSTYVTLQGSPGILKGTYMSKAQKGVANNLTVSFDRPGAWIVYATADNPKVKKVDWKVTVSNK